MILGVPVCDGHEWTRKLHDSLRRTVRGPFHLVVVDNGSVEPYTVDEFQPLAFRVTVLRTEGNIGYYRPLEYLAESVDASDPLVGLVHNDLLVHEPGWDLRLASCFAADPLLDLVGFCGSYQVDHLGGRGGGTMCRFRERDPITSEVIGQSQAAGLYVEGLKSSVVLDSLFMMFRREAVRDLEAGWDSVPLAHFWDRVWPMRLVRRGRHVGTLGVEVSHWGGITLVGNPRYQGSVRGWCEAEGIGPHPKAVYSDGGVNWDLTMYYEVERRFLEEFKDTIPCWIDNAWNLYRG